MIPGMDVERGIFEAVRRHEAEESAAIGIHSGLIRESDTQVTVAAEESRRVTDDGARWEPRARIDDGLDRGKSIGGPQGTEREEPESEEARERFNWCQMREVAHS